jgi:transcriptional regulator with XRE-family HTH domain
MFQSKIHYWLKDENLSRIRGWARRGLKPPEIARLMGITPATLMRWCQKQPQLEEAAAPYAAEDADLAVEDALLRRALGYISVDVVRELRKDPATGQERMIETKRTSKEVMPSTTAQIFWLKARCPEIWASRSEDAPASGEEEMVEIVYE